jgi:hypothetical protein
MKHNEDMIIAESALIKGCILVTTDKILSKKIKRVYPDKEKHETSDITFSRITVFGGERLIWEQISAGDPSVSSSLDETQVIDTFTVETTTHGSFKRLER